ncbi:MAG TPA: thioesterase family protein [Ilumatobacteraceae bacterium]
MGNVDQAERSLFRRVDDGLVLPTELARGPWTPLALHGGPVAALIAQAVEEVSDDGVDWFVARLTVDIERPVPLEPLAIETVVTRPGRKVSIVDSTLTLAATGMVLARARALRIRSANITMPYEDPTVGPMLQREAAPAGPEHGAHHDITSAIDYTAFHADAVEHRYLALPEPEGGEVFDWIRMTAPVLPDRPLTPLQRVAGVADFANGISHVLPFDTHLFINADLTIHMFQPMKGEWVGMASRSHHGPHGVGMSDTALFDTEGRIGRSEQSLLLELR